MDEDDEHFLSAVFKSLLGPYRGILALGRFRTDLAALGPYCHDLGPIFPLYGPRTRLVRGSYCKIHKSCDQSIGSHMCPSQQGFMNY